MQHRAQSHIKKQRNLTTAKLHILKKIITHQENTIASWYILFFDDMLHSTSRLKIVNTGRLSPGAPIQYKDDTLPVQEIPLLRRYLYIESGPRILIKSIKNSYAWNCLHRLSGSKTVLHLDSKTSYVREKHHATYSRELSCTFVATFLIIWTEHSEIS